MRLRWIPPLLALCWGLNWPTVKVIVGSLPPFAFRTVGLGVGGLLLLGLALAQGRRLVPPEPRQVLLGGLLNVAGFNLCTVFAQLATTTSRAAVLTYTMPMMSALLAGWLLGERLDRRRAGALALGGAGIALLAWPVLRTLGPQADRRALVGLALPLAAAAFWALGTVAAKRWPAGGDRIANTGWQLLVGGACAAIGWLAHGERWPDAVPGTVWLALGYHVVVATAFAYVIWFVLLDQVSATVSSLTTLAVPVIGVGGAMALVGERPGAIDWIGFALVLAGAARVMMGPAPQRPANSHQET